MAPRPYSSTKRAQAVDQTRKRITEAVVQLHREKGVLATTYEDIARRADVAPATVYRHFPTVDSLIPVCGERILEITSPPGPDAVQGAPGQAQALQLLVCELFAFWKRVEPWLNVGRCESPRVPALAANLRMWDEGVRALIRFALGDGAADDTVRLVKAMTDFYTWKALAAEDLEDQAASIVTEMLLNHLGINNSPATEGGRKCRKSMR